MTDKENENVEGGPWWVRLVKGSKQFRGKVWRLIKATPGHCRDALMEWDHKSFWFYYVPATTQVVAILLVEAFNRPPDALDSGRRLGAGLWTWKEIWSDAGQSMATVAIVAAVLGETGRFALVLAQERYDKLKKSRNRLIQQGHAAGHAEARAEFEAENKAWYKRQQEALAKGEPFDEPLPRVHQEESAD